MIMVLFAVSLLFPFLYKYTFTATNQFTQLPIVKSFLDPGYLTRDWYVNLSREFGPRTFFAAYTAFFAKFAGLPATYLAHFVLSAFLTLYATYKLGIILTGNKKASIFTAVTILFGATYTIGGNLLVTRDFTVTQLSLSLSLLAIVLILEKKFIKSFAVFALATYFHPLIGPESAFLSFMAFSYSVYGESQKKIISNFIKPLKGTLIYVLLTLPLLYFYFQHRIPEIPPTVKIDIVAFMRTPHHFLPSVFPLRDYLGFSAVILISSIILFSKRGGKLKNFRGFFAAFCVLNLLLTGFSLLSVFVFNFYPGAVIQPFRLTLYIYWMSAVAVYGYIFNSVITGKTNSFFLFVPFFLSDFSRITTGNRISILSALLGILLLLFFRTIKFPLSLIFLIVFFSLFNYHEKFNYDSYFSHPTLEVEMAEFAKRNSDDSDIFIVPPEFEKFRLISERAILADWKAFPFQEDGYYQWYLRMCDLGNVTDCQPREISQDTIVRGFRSHNEQTINALSKKYGADYLISEKDYPGFRKIYGNYYKIYKLK